MSELAFNINGEAFEVPATACGWRVRRMRAKGSPEVVYGRDGLPLTLPIDAELDDLKSEVDVTGRYRLDLVDGNNKALPLAPSGYVQVNRDVPPVMMAPAPAAPTAPNRAMSDNIVIEAMRLNSEVAKAVVERFPQMMESAAVLLRAADGAGLPARPGMALDDGDEDEADDNDEDDEAPPLGGLDIGALLAQAAPLFLAFASGKVKIPDLASLLNWDKAAKKGAASRQAQAETGQEAPVGDAPTSRPDPGPTVEEQLMSDPAAMAHFLAIMNELTSEEAALARGLALELSSNDQIRWLKELKAMSVSAAAQKVRGLLVTMSKKGGAS